MRGALVGLGVIFIEKDVTRLGLRANGSCSIIVVVGCLTVVFFCWLVIFFVPWIFVQTTVVLRVGFIMYEVVRVEMLVES